MIVAATGACAASVQKLAGLGVRWQGADAASSKFGRFAWLDRGRGTLTLGGTPAECRDSGGGNFRSTTTVMPTPRPRPRCGRRPARARSAQVAEVTAAGR